MKCIKTFSNKFAPTKFAPEVTANNRTISILPHSIFFEEKEYAFHDAVDIDVPELTDDVSLKVYFVEDMSNNEIIVVADFIAESSNSRWLPDPQKHRIIHTIIDGRISRDFQDVNDCNLYLNEVSFPKNTDDLLVHFD